MRETQELSWKKWSKRLNTYLSYMQTLFWPDLIILGGGVSKKHDKFLHHLDVASDITPAQMRNEAGIVGAAIAASKLKPKRR